MSVFAGGPRCPQRGRVREPERGAFVACDVESEYSARLRAEPSTRWGSSGSTRRVAELLTLFILLPLAVHAAGPTVTVVDGAGRTLQVPAQIERAYVTSPVGAVLLYTLAPERLVGWNYKLGAAEKHFLLPSVHDLPALGGWFGENGKGNRETLLLSLIHI